MSIEIPIRVEAYKAIDYSTIYEIMVGEDIKAGTILRFDPAIGVMHVVGHEEEKVLK